MVGWFGWNLNVPVGKQVLVSDVYVYERLVSDVYERLVQRVEIMLLR
jgi:hypothetical protein